MSNRLNPEEYLSTIENDVERQTVRLMFSCARAILNQLHGRFSPEEEFPVLWVDDDEKMFSPYQSENRIWIPSRFIRHCRTAHSLTTTDAFGVDSPLSQISQNHCPDAIFGWAVGHEYIHHLRQHAAVEDEEGNDERTRQAMELDADCCSIAALYRIWQILHKDKYSNEDTRRYTLYLIFLGILTIPADTPQIEHASLAARLNYMAMKMAIATVVDNNKIEIPDSSFEREETLQRLFELYKLMHRMEKIADIPGRPMRAELLEHLAGRSDIREITSRWEEIRTTVSRCVVARGLDFFNT